MSAPVTHVDADALAEFRAGLVTGRRGTRIAAHLAGCDRCAALDRELAGVSTLLASVPAPGLPDHVAQRLDAALAAEVATRDNPERAGREPAPEPGASDRRAAHRGFRLPSLRVLAPIGAAAAVVLAAGGYGLSLIAQGPGNQSIASSAGSAPSVAASANRAAAPTASARSGASIHSQRKSYAAFNVMPTSTNFQATGLQQQLEQALKAASVAGARQQASAQVQACVRKVAGNADLVLVLLAHYEGHPATIVVARTAHGEQAWVASPGCVVLDRASLLPGNLRALVSVHWSASQMRG